MREEASASLCIAQRKASCHLNDKDERTQHQFGEESCRLTKSRQEEATQRWVDVAPKPEVSQDRENHQRTGPEPWGKFG